MVLTAHACNVSSPQTQIPNGWLKWQFLLYSAFLCELADVIWMMYKEWWPLDKTSWGEMEESEKASRHRESNPGHLACADSALPSHWVAARWFNWGIPVPPVHCWVCSAYRGLWLFCCRSSVAKHWPYKPGVLGSVPFFYFASKHLNPFTPWGKMI